jgi:hypothetical protein
MNLPATFNPYLDANGRIPRLPSRLSRKIELSMALLERIAPGIEYSEKQINEILFEVVDDFALVRRTLVDMGYLSRDSYGRTYKRVISQVQAAS